MGLRRLEFACLACRCKFIGFSDRVSGLGFSLPVRLSFICSIEMLWLDMLDRGT